MSPFWQFLWFLATPVAALALAPAVPAHVQGTITRKNQGYIQGNEKGKEGEENTEALVADQQEKHFEILA